MAGEKSTTYANDVLKKTYQGTDFSWNANTNLYIALHTTDPTASGTQTTSEISYTGYARVAVARSGAGFTVSGNSVSPVAAITFGACTAGSGTATHFSVGTASSGAGQIIQAGPITPNIVISNGVTPQLAATTAITEA